MTILPPPCYYTNLTLVAVGLSSKLWSFITKIKTTAYYKNMVGIKKKLIKKILCCYSAAIHVNFLHLLIGRSGILCVQRMALVVLRRGQEPLPQTPPFVQGEFAASAESCTHPTKRDHCFPPPIAESQRLPNVGIAIDVWCLGTFPFHNDISLHP